MVLLQKHVVSTSIDRCNNDIAASSAIAKLECDYDVNPTELYQAIEARQWDYVINMFQQKEENKLSKSNTKENNANVTEQANTWILRKELDGRLRWRMLPIHALMVFKAPFKVTDAILSVAPNSVNSKDDRGMIPLHLGFRYEADDESLSKLILMSPDTIEIKDRKGRTPLQMVNAATSKTGKLIQEYNRIASAAERRKVSVELNIDKERKMDVFKNAYEQEITVLKKKLSHTEAEVKSARTACNAMMTRVANMSSVEKQLRENNDNLREQKLEKHNLIATLESKINHINNVYCCKENLHVKALKRPEEEQCASISLEDIVDNVEKSMAKNNEQYHQAIRVISEKDDVISNLHKKIDQLDELNQTKAEEVVMAQLKCKEAEQDVALNHKEKTVLAELAEGAKFKSCNLSNTVENLTCRNAHLEKELGIQEKKVEQHRDWLNNAQRVFGMMLNDSSTNLNNAREKIILSSADSTDKQELELQLVADNRERASVAEEIWALKRSVDRLIATDGKMSTSMSDETAESFFQL